MQNIFKEEIKLSFLVLNFMFFYEDQKNLDEIFKFSFYVEKLSRENWKVPSTFWGLFKPNWITDWRLSLVYKFSAWNRFYNNLTFKQCKSNDNQLTKFGSVNWKMIWVNLVYFKIRNIEYYLMIQILGFSWIGTWYFSCLNSSITVI